MLKLRCNKCKKLLHIRYFGINTENRTIAGRCDRCKSEQYNYPYQHKRLKGTAKKPGRKPKNAVIAKNNVKNFGGIKHQPEVSSSIVANPEAKIFDENRNIC